MSVSPDNLSINGNHRQKATHRLSEPPFSRKRPPIRYPRALANARPEKSGHFHPPIRSVNRKAESPDIAYEDSAGGLPPACLVTQLKPPALLG